MRLFTLLATAVLLAACVHDTDDTLFFLTESGASLTYYIGSGGGADQKNHDDPWDTISEGFSVETVHTGKGKSDGTTDYDDPWDAIRKKFDVESIYAGKSDQGDTPWDYFVRAFPAGRFQKRRWGGHVKSVAVFVSFQTQTPTDARARVSEIRGKILKLTFADGAEQYVVNPPEGWAVGTQIETTFHASRMKKSLPWLGVRLWRTAKVSDTWESPAIAPQRPWEAVVPDTVDGELLWPDPWDQITDAPLRNY